MSQGDVISIVATIFGGYSQNGNALDNTINITGGDFSGATNIIGGYSETTTGTLPALTGNTIILASTSPTGLNLSNVVLTGGQHGLDSSTADIRLIVKNKAIVGDVRNFEYYEFYITNSTDDALLTSTGTIDFGTDAKISINIADTSEIFDVGSFIKLINTTSEANIIGSVLPIYAEQGISLRHTLTENYDDVKNIYGMTVSSTAANPLSAAFPESRLASFSFMNQANNLILGQGITSAINAIATNPSQWTFFGLVQGVFSGYDTEIGDINGTTNF